MSLIDAILGVARRVPFVSRLANRAATNLVCAATTPRPRAFSLWSHVERPDGTGWGGEVGEYTTWPMLTDRLYSARHLPPADKAAIRALPDDTPRKNAAGETEHGQVTELFRRHGTMQKGRSSVLFMFFAQWFTDSVLRVDPMDRRKNTSNHNIDLCQIYGLKETTATLLRSKINGKLASQMIGGEEYPDDIGEINPNGTWDLKCDYKKLPYVADGRFAEITKDVPKSRVQKMYATGLERGNSSIGYVAVSTLFLREHNRICTELAKLHPSWDDERFFQTARMINIVILMKLVVQDYINHIAGENLFRFDRSFAEKKDWYRTPWIALEFDLLYRWHGLIPDEVSVDNVAYDETQFRANNPLLETAGLAAILEAAASQHAGQISLNNVPDWLLGAEYHMIRMGREARLQPYNAYRAKFGLDRLTSFDQLNDDSRLRTRLSSMYDDDIDKVELVVGLFAQKHKAGHLYGDLMYKMVAYDAFTQIYTNPLLSNNVYTAETFTRYGLDLIEATNTLQDLVDRNVKQKVLVRMGFETA